MRTIGMFCQLSFQTWLRANCVCRVISHENSLVWHQQVLGWLNKYSGIGKENKDAVSLEDTVVPVVNINPPA